MTTATSLAFEDLVELCVQRLEWSIAVETKAIALENECVALEESLERYTQLSGEASAVDFSALIETARARLAQASRDLQTVYRDPVDPSPAALRQVPMDMVRDAVAKQLVGVTVVSAEAVFRAVVGLAERWNGRSLVMNTHAGALFAGLGGDWTSSASGFPWKVEK